MIYSYCTNKGGEKMALETRIQVRCTTEELEEFKELAEDNGFTLSDYIRYLLENGRGGDEE